MFSISIATSDTRYGVLLVDDSVLVDELLDEDPGSGVGTTVVFSVDVFVLVLVCVAGPGIGITVLVCVSLVGTTVVVCVSTAGGFSTVVLHPVSPITASVKSAAIPMLGVFMVFPLVVSRIDTVAS